MKWLKLVRTFNEGCVNFYRNGWLTFATVSILATSLFIISITIMLGFTANLIIANLQDKINVSVYFNSSVTEERVMEIKDKLSQYDEVKSVDYVSKEKALEELLGLSSNAETINKALEEIGENPLPASIVIRANDPGQYEKIAESVNNSFFKDDISSVNYAENKKVIDRLTGIILMSREVGTIFGLVFVFVSILITFNAIRITMYSHRQEFEVMRLVGASNLYIRMPFVFEGILYGFVAGIVVMILLFVASYFISPLTDGNIPQGNLLKVYFSNFFLIIGGLIAGGVLLGVISSFIAIRRYLKI
ncbi:MAG: Cell division protein FtsX [Candidatus Moranbacteria bacterium GW2011_GWC2_45_10]|nr:MAG: Cell division protein FtsX [Candidatus Moranbacteria bacterium GW2011_GWC2_45_10]